MKVNFFTSEPFNVTYKNQKIPLSTGKIFLIFLAGIAGFSFFGVGAILTFFGTSYLLRERKITELTHKDESKTGQVAGKIIKNASGLIDLFHVETERRLASQGIYFEFNNDRRLARFFPEKVVNALPKATYYVCNPSTDRIIELTNKNQLNKFAESDSESVPVILIIKDIMNSDLFFQNTAHEVTTQSGKKLLACTLFCPDSPAARKTNLENIQSLRKKLEH